MSKGFALAVVVIIGLICFTIGFTAVATATEYHVKQDGSGDFTAIQDAIDYAIDGDDVIVHLGTYYENINFDGKNIVVRSDFPAELLYDREISDREQQVVDDVVNVTIIDGGRGTERAGTPTVRFEGIEDATCVLAGFTITNGFSWSGGGGIRGANDQYGYYGWGVYTEAEVRFCDINNNHAFIGGGGISEFNGTLFRCAITDNESNFGGGLVCCNIWIIDSTIAYNHGDYGGGGAFLTLFPDGENKLLANEANVGGGIYMATIVGDILIANEANTEVIKRLLNSIPPDEYRPPVIYTDDNGAKTGKFAVGLDVTIER